MGFPIERWARQAIRRERRGISEMNGGRGTERFSWPVGPMSTGKFPKAFEPVASPRILQDLQELAVLYRAQWKERQLALNDLGVPQMGEGTYGVLMGYPLPAVLSTTSISGTANLWPGAVYTPIPANGVLTPQAYRIVVAAKMTTSTTPGNIGLDPRIGQGTWTTGGTAITGTTLGATGNVALTASITASFYYVFGDITIRSVGNPGNNTTAVGMFTYVATQGTSAGLAGPAAFGTGHQLMFGGTTASYDGTVAQGFQLGAVHTVTTITHNVDQIHGMDWN